MLTKTKAFDCVEMKHQAQQRLHSEYEARKGEFSSYFEFLEARATQSSWQRDFWAKIAANRIKAEP
jgi:hypothetical protein